MRTVPLTPRQLEKLAAYQREQQALQDRIDAYLSGIAEGADPPPALGTTFRVQGGQLVIED